jgi:hypothetical protein
MLKKPLSVKLLLVFALVSLLINFITILLHESGHALVYTAQGYTVEFGLTRADPVGGTAGGLLMNILMGSIFLLLFLRYKFIYFFAVVVANTFMVRIVLYLLRFLFGQQMAFKDERLMASFLNINPEVVAVFIFLLLLLILIPAIKKLSDLYSRTDTLKIVTFAFGATIITLAFFIPLEETLNQFI